LNIAPNEQPYLGVKSKKGIIDDRYENSVFREIRCHKVRENNGKFPV